jgi:hypothetical protein
MSKHYFLAVRRGLHGLSGAKSILGCFTGTLLVGALVMTVLPVHAVKASGQGAPTSLRYSGTSYIRSHGRQTVTAVLTDPTQNVPVPARTVSFALNGIITTATTDDNGVATANFNFEPELPAGALPLQVNYAGDNTYEGSDDTWIVNIFPSVPFVIWGGNSEKLKVGQDVNFWGHSWADQVTGGQFGANPSFKGFADEVAVTPFAQCQTTATIATLTPGCWQTKPGNSFPPATLPATIEVIVSTAIVKSGPNIFGNIACTAILDVDASPAYGPNPGHPGFGKIRELDNCQ